MTGKKVSKGCALLLFGTILSLGLGSCSGGGFEPTPLPSIDVAVDSASTVLAPTTGETVVRVDYTVTAAANTAFSLLFQFFVDTNGNGDLDSGEVAFTMTEVSSALESLLGVMSENGAGLTPVGSNGMVSGTFYWQAGADVGFVGGTFALRIVPTALNLASNAGTFVGFTYVAGSPSVTASLGSQNLGAMGVSVGRAEHTAHEVTAGQTESVLAIGGIDGSMAAIASIDRFGIDLANRTASDEFSANSAVVRRGHASSIYFSGTAINVLVTGGSVGGTPTASADRYTSTPEAIAAMTPNMNVARDGHAACWLPDNRILITGGRSMAAANSAEIYDPATNTFTSVQDMLNHGRAEHTCSLLPTGQVLIAGGRDPMNLTAILNAEIFDPATLTFTDTGVPINRYQHTATLLVNGVCALIGGRRIDNGQVVNSADFYRTFSENFGGTTIPAGFVAGLTNITLVAARAEHGAARLGNSQILITGGFDSGAPANALSSAEVFVPSDLTDPAIGHFSAITALMQAARARHTSTTVNTGSNVVMGGVSGTGSTVLNSVEVFQFSNSAPVVSALSAVGQTNGNVNIRFILGDFENDRSFVFARFSLDNGVTYHLATLVSPQSAVNLLPGTYDLEWNVAADGLSSGQSVQIEIVPVGGVIGSPFARAITIP